MRLDQYLVAHRGFQSRTKAAQSIIDHDVLVNGQSAKPSTIIQPEDDVQVLKTPHYVSRSADKLLEAIEAFKLDFKHQTILDIGQSTGGFTQVALEAGAAKVIGIDVGQDQLDASLRQDQRVTCIEQTNLKQLSELSLPKIDTGLIDVSFISTIEHLPIILPYASNWLLLIKPQFETKGQSLRNGIVTNQQAIEDVIKHLNEALIELRYDLKGIIPSRTKGKTGNQEYMVWVQKDVTRVVD